MDIEDIFRRSRNRQTDTEFALRDNSILSGTERQLVKILGSSPFPSTVPNQFACYAVSATGTETVGVPPAISAIGSQFIVTVLGPILPIPGDYLIAYPYGGRWYARKSQTYTNKITVPGCPCPIPSPLNMSVVHPEASVGVFQNAVLAYGPIPPELAALGLGTKAFLSTSKFVDILTLDYFWYNFFCSSGFFCINRLYATSAYGSPFADSIRYRWLVGQPGNTCSPFLMSNGKIYPGGDPTIVVVISE